jgi:hypothetical protein
MVRDCDIPQSVGDDPYFKCQFVNKSSIEEIVNATINVVDNRIVGKIMDAREDCCRISQHLVRPVYWDIPTGGCVHGIFACLPYEILHLFYLGLMKYLLHALYNLREVPKIVTDWYSICCGRRRYHTAINDEGNSEDSSNDGNEDNDSDIDSLFSKSHSHAGNKKDNRPTVGFKTLKKLFNKSEFEKRFRVVTNAARRQSDREMPRAPFKNGVTDQTHLTGQEYPGLCLITLVAMKGMLHGHSKSLETLFAQLIFMTLSLECALTLDSYPEEFLSRLDSIITKYLDIYRRVVGPFRECYSSSGLRISKFHGLLHSTFYIRRYGNTYNYFGGFCESHLKSLVKQPSKSTSRRQERLDLDLMNRQHESHVCHASESNLRSLGWFEDKDASKSDNSDTELRFPDHQNSPANAEDELGFRPHKTAFTAKRSQSTQWQTFYEGTVYNRGIFPSVRGSYGSQWVNSIIDFASQD